MSQKNHTVSVHLTPAPDIKAMKTFTLSKSFRFEAAHQLPLHDGKCARLHGHSWVVTIEVSGDILITGGPQTGMLIDYGEISKAMRPLLDDQLDHHYLNATLGLEHPTSEQVAMWIYWRLLPALPSLSAVIIEETCTSRCEYRPTQA